MPQVTIRSFLPKADQPKGYGEYFLWGKFYSTCDATPYSWSGFESPRSTPSKWICSTSKRKKKRPQAQGRNFGVGGGFNISPFWPLQDFISFPVRHPRPPRHNPPLPKLAILPSKSLKSTIFGYVLYHQHLSFAPKIHTAVHHILILRRMPYCEREISFNSWQQFMTGVVLCLRRTFMNTLILGFSLE